MEKATISELKNRLSAYLKKVRAGRSILIVDRDQPIAKLERIEAGAEGDDRLARLERAGLVRRGSGRLDLAALRRAAPRSRTSVLDALVQDRREGR
ncbi:MAG TPA: type II toxin-antitoxin system prevent-host-death family antitoxin [Anaeromyxobacteraceae bacterium]|nr:type II toxin-antitoxin system prevent-host-death family antitoxin [Anaeromyxobacteraceae bacterium]